mmetsp:Transcript_5871/g.19958  ORF Transcript_5871/g.19958 Transcript_5871/m.19958 type:complete len:105 (+) Transcript_5871:67-381(+)
MPILDTPKFPVIDESPSFWSTVENFSLAEYGNLATVTAGSGAVGYFSGLRVFTGGLTPKMAVPSMYMGATIGALAGFMMAYQGSAGRLMGLKNNELEQKIYQTK